KKIEEKSKKSTPDIIPGYYSNKQHWNSVKPDGDVPDDLLKALLDRSYTLVFKKLPKKTQKEILERENAQ
ncbi:MAG: MmcQ/YjbR family DNA-binding protein, partial [Clostridia bacterium]|nr:MmcQ/YjbR family DNA-binding protein [Clostridia bacterium]